MTSAAFLVDQLFSAAPGGIGTYVRELVPALERADPTLSIRPFHARFGVDARRAVLEREPWLRGRRIEELKHPIRTLYPAWAAARRPRLPLSLSGLDVLHSPSPAAVPVPGRSQRLVVTVHDLAFVVHPELFPKRWRVMYRLALERAVRSADAVLTVSNHTAQDLSTRTRIDPARVHVTLPAAPALMESSDPDAELVRLRVSRPYLLFVGTLEPRKNLVRLVRAFRSVTRAIPHSLVLAGPMGWHAGPLLREAAEAGGRVVMPGALGSAEALDALYRGADAFVYPSLYEGFGLPVLEAMARGVPCVVSRVSSLPEVVGEDALYVDPHSIDDLSGALRRGVEDENLATSLRAAGPTRAAMFSWDRTARGTLDVYRAL